MVVEYNMKQSFIKQVIAATKILSTVVWAKMTSEEFVQKTVPIPTMVSYKISAVFSSSISYHIDIIRMFQYSSIASFDCVFVHDTYGSGSRRAPTTVGETIGRSLTTMTIIGNNTA